MWAAYYGWLAVVGVAVPVAVRRWPQRRRRALALAVGAVALSTAVMLAHPDRVLVYHRSPLPAPAASPSSANV